MKLFQKYPAFLLFLLLFCCSTPTMAQANEQQQVYNKAIDDINCATIKLLLIGFDRPVAAKAIQPCTYGEISTEVRKVKENQVKGYRAMILKLAGEIDGYKGKVENPSEYSLFENAMEEVGAYALSQFRSICQKFQRPNNSVCVRLDQKVLQLESEINDIVNETLVKVGQNTYGGDRAQKRVKAPSPKKDKKPSTNIDKAKDNSTVTEESADITAPGTSKKSGSWLITIFLVLLAAAVAWLFKENYELREKMEDVEMLVNVLTNNRKEGE